MGIILGVLFGVCVVVVFVLVVLGIVLYARRRKTRLGPLVPKFTQNKNIMLNFTEIQIYIEKKVNTL